MKIKLAIPLLATLAIAAVAGTGATAAASGSAASLTIRHQLRGCHSWSLNGVTYKPSQSLTLQRGGTLTVTNNDVMSHKLIEKSGPAFTITRVKTGMGMGMKGMFPPAMLARMGSSSKLTFSKRGVYTFTTKPGEDFMPGITTVGPDNVLRLTVTVR